LPYVHTNLILDHMYVLFEGSDTIDSHLTVTESGDVWMCGTLTGKQVKTFSSWDDELTQSVTTSFSLNGQG